MKKFIFLLVFGFLVLAVPTLILAKNEGKGLGINNVQTSSPSPSATPLEEEKDFNKTLNSRSENAREHMSVVAQEVERLLIARTVKGGIGEQVRVIAQAQNDEQPEIENKLENIEGRGKLLKFVLGTDYKSINALGKIIGQNEVRIEELTKLMAQTANQADKTALQNLITALTNQNTALRDIIKAEENLFSLFGWFNKLINK